MNKEEAKLVILKELEHYRSMSFAELRELLDRIDAYGVTSPSGIDYQIEVHAIWDDKPEDNIRVFGEISDSGLLRSFLPLCESFIMTPGGQFLDENEA
jgi:hypothetical protein